MIKQFKRLAVLFGGIFILLLINAYFLWRGDLWSPPAFLGEVFVFAFIYRAVTKNQDAKGNNDRQNYELRYSREVISPEVQKFVWQRDNGRCVKCGSQERLEFDHVIPVSKGGSNTARNLQLLCEHCNRSKHANIGE
jgi:hypothetical protein